MLPNSTYLIEVMGQTEATTAGGIGPPACLVMTTDPCLDLQPELQGAVGSDCPEMEKRLQVMNP